MLRPIRILLRGGGYENKGAEAMLRTVQTELGRRLTGAEFMFWPLRPNERPLAQASGLVPFAPPFEAASTREGRPIAAPRRLHSFIVRRTIGRTEAFRSRAREKARKEESTFNEACLLYLNANPRLFDVLVDISGFAYSDAWGMSGYEAVFALSRHCRQAKKPVFFMPQAWGPFHTQENQSGIRDLLDGDNVHFYSRDAESSRYLGAVLGQQNQAVEPFPDIAFLFEGGSPDQGRDLLRRMGCTLERPIVGIAPNMRVYERVAGAGLENEYVRALASLARRCIEQWDADVVLQSNEMSLSDGLDDRYLCSLLADMLVRPDRCFVPNEYQSAEVVWSLTGCFDLLLASRFHALVFGFSQGVPAAALGWSHKYEELLSLFGWKDEVAKQGSFDSRELIDVIDRVWNERADRRAHLRAELPLLQNRLVRLFDTVADLIREVETEPAE